MRPGACPPSTLSVDWIGTTRCFPFAPLADEARWLPQTKGVRWGAANPMPCLSQTLRIAWATSEFSSSTSHLKAKLASTTTKSLTPTPLFQCP